MYMNLTEQQWEDAYVFEIMRNTNVTEAQARLCLKHAMQDVDYGESPTQAAQDETIDWDYDFYTEEN